jgi:hypothetical protein
LDIGFIRQKGLRAGKYGALNLADLYDMGIIK